MNELQTMNQPAPMLLSNQNEIATTALAAQAKAMIESRYYMAMRNPRVWDQVRQDILKECQRPSFANNKSAFYRKPIGNGVEGLGIRFVEVALRCMKNVLTEINMVHEDDAKEIFKVSVTDLESNITYPMDVKVSKTVERSKPFDDGSYVSVRENSRGKKVYTVQANDDDIMNKRNALISKAIRTLGLRIIPGDIQDEAEATIKQIRNDKAAQDPDGTRKHILDSFSKIGVKATQLQEYLGHSLDTASPAELVDLRGLYGAIRDGEATWKTVMDNLAEERGEQKNKEGLEPITSKKSAESTESDENAPDCIEQHTDKKTSEIEDLKQQEASVPKWIHDEGYGFLLNADLPVLENFLEEQLPQLTGKMTTSRHKKLETIVLARIEEEKGE